MREAMSLAHLMDSVPDRLRRDLASCFKALFSDPADPEARRRLTALTETLLAVEPDR